MHLKCLIAHRLGDFKFLKRTTVLAIFVISFFVLSSVVLASQIISVNISSQGHISFGGAYVCGNYNSTHYYAQNDRTGQIELTSVDAVQTINYALGKLPGRTSQETIFLRGQFSINSTITLSQGNVILDCKDSTLTLTANTTLFKINGGKNYTFVSGHWVGPNTGSSTALSTMNCANILVDGTDIQGFVGNLGGIIVVGYATSNFTAQNCFAHGNTRSGIFDLVNTAGHNKIINCTMDDIGNGIFISAHNPSNQILRCVFSYWNVSGGHAIYMDGSGSTDEGNNTVSDCIFHDGINGAGLQIKCANNSIHGNIFYNFISHSAIPFSIYSQYSPSTANSNDIYNNTFTNCFYGIKIGHSPAEYPTVQNKIHNNNFVNVNNCILLNPWSGATNTVEDTWIYYNTFRGCTTVFPISGSPLSLIINTVVAYNDFGGNITELSVLQQYVNSMVYGNIGMPDYNVPSSLPVPPP
jgi:hypothetical protein